MDKAGDRRQEAGVRLNMFLKLVTASFFNRRGRMLIVLLSLMIGAAVVTGIVSIYRDIGGQFGRELRSYGANLVGVPEYVNGAIDPRRLDKAAKAFGSKLVGYSPYLYGRASWRRSEVIIVGLRASQLDKISPYLKVSGSRRPNRDQALVGQRLADRLGWKRGQAISLKAVGGVRTVTVAGVVESGGTEDNQVFLELEAAQELLKRPSQASLGYLSVDAQGPELASAAAEIGRRFGVKLEPVSRISRNESRVLDRIKNLVLLVTGVILITTVLSVTTTMMALVIERRREVGLKKALGAGNRAILAEFAGEGLVIGFIGGTIGWLAGFLFAQWIGTSVFDSFLTFSPWTLLISIGISLVVAVLALVVPVRMALDVEPAIVLKGE